MKPFLKYFYFFILAILSLNACKNDPEKGSVLIDEDEIIKDVFVITEDVQSKLSPDFIIDALKKGNTDYTQDNLTVRNTSARIRNASLGQHPAAVILSCLDSRVPVEDVFHAGIGDLFVARVAGNISNVDILGSLEYACKVSGAKVIVVMGHEHCGAVKSAIQDVKLGNITELLSKIKPAIDSLKEFSGEKSYNNLAYMEAVTHANIHLTIDNIRRGSAILKEMEQNGEIKIVGAEYHMETGKVDFL
ncbi:carbonic anhydrase [Terrimonas sp.]|nr:carbonic anhydrase [Terrimonas sp.]